MKKNQPVLTGGTTRQHPRRLTPRRLLLAVAIAASTLAAACDRSTTVSESQKVASITLEVDIATGEVHSVSGTPPGGASASKDPTRAPGKLAALTNVDGLLRPSNLGCLGCKDGTLGAHQVSLTLTNASAFTISSLIEVIQCVSNCSVLAATNPPADPVSPGGSFNAAVAVDVPALDKFTIRIDYIGNVT